MSIRINKITWVCNNSELVELDSNLQYISTLGKGAYGFVVKVRDKDKDNAEFAIKKCKHVTKSRITVKRTLREIKILRLIDHPNVIRIRSILRPSENYFEDIYIVFELMHADLSALVKSSQEISIALIKHLSTQLFKGLEYLHGIGIVHRDLKSKNILVNIDCQLKIADFGLARSYGGERWSQLNAVKMTDYITTRWYRSPEIFMGYELAPVTSSDIWSSGCVICELVLRTPLYNGNDSFDMLSQMVNLIGPPSPDFLENCRKERYVDFVKKIAEKSDTSINNDCHRLKSLIQNEEIYDLISKLLLFQPEKRISAREVLDHHFLKIENEVIQETSSNPGLICLMNSFENSFDTRANTLTDMRRYILREISAYHENMEIDTSAFFYEDSLKKNRKQIAANANRIDDKISTCLIV